MKTRCVLSVLFAGALHLHSATNEVAPGVLLVGHIQGSEITESSGLIPSRRARGFFWTHDDTGTDTLFAITPDGSVTGQFEIRDVKLKNWEDVAAGPGRLYLADIGNNDRTRNSVDVYAIAEPHPKRTGAVSPGRHWILNYPDEPFDAESFFILGGYGYVLSKDLSGGEADVYRFKLSGKAETTLAKRCRLDVDAPAAGADITPDGRRLAVITNQGAYLFAFKGGIPAHGKVEPSWFTPFLHDRMEGCCFTRDGLLVTAESGEIFLFSDPQFQLRSGAKVLR